MRHARIRPQHTDTFMHLYNRVGGHVGEYPFGPCEKEYFINLMHKLTNLYTVQIMAYQLMGNHFHMIGFAPGAALPEADAVDRFNRYYDGKRIVIAGSPRAELLPDQLRDVSRFMKDLQQGFTRWFNRTRPVRRRGHLWQERFKNTILEDGLAVWDCWKYVEMNPVRAHLAASPADYRFCSFGAWAGTGRNPCDDALLNRVIRSLPEALGVTDTDSLHRSLRKVFAVTAAVDASQPQAIVEAVALRAAEKEAFSTRVDRRVRYWVDGLVIGSDVFVKTLVAQARGEWAVSKRRLTRAVAPDPAVSRPALYAFKQLRTII